MSNKSELEPSIWDIFDPLRAHNWDREGIRFISTFPLYTAVFGYHEYRGEENVPKFFAPNIDLATDPMRALENEEHIGIWNYVTNIFLPAAMLASVIGIKLREAAENSEDKSGPLMLAWVFWWIIRGPLIALALFVDALKKALLVLTLASLTALFSPVIIVAAVCVVGASLLIAKKQSKLKGESAENSDAENSERSHESPLKLLAHNMKNLFCSTHESDEDQSLSEEITEDVALSSEA